MGPGQDRAQVLDADARVELRRGEAAMSGELLHLADAGAASQKMRRAHVAQRVRVGADPGRTRVAPDDESEPGLA